MPVGHGSGSTPNSGRPNLVRTQSVDKPKLHCGQQLRKRAEVVATGGGDLERGIQVDADHVPARRQPQVFVARQQDIPGLMLLLADQGVFAVGAEPPVGSGLASGAREAIVVAGSAVLGPSARLEVPAAESPDNDMDASR
jgi:hypothetical protein